MTRVRQVLNLGRVEENSEVGVFVVRVEAGSVVGIVDQFDLLDVLGLGLIEVGIGGVNDDSHCASLGNRLWHE